MHSIRQNAFLKLAFPFKSIRPAQGAAYSHNWAPRLMTASHSRPNSTERGTSNPDILQDSLRYPRNVQALYLTPLRREAEYGVPSCDLQLRSYTASSVDFFAEFAVRAAYYVGLPAYGPIPLPKITERWTVLKSPFAYKKSQENFERVTLRRLIQIRDGHPKAVHAWLAFLRKHAYYGVGMKANMWEYGTIDRRPANTITTSPTLQNSWSRFS